MKRKIGIILIITFLILLFLKEINVLQVENGLALPLPFFLLFFLCSILSIFLQNKIDKNYSEKAINYDNLDVLKYICAILVIILHLRPFQNFSNSFDLAFNNIITRICVPIFFVITGYFCAVKEKKNPNYINEYVKKNIPFYLFWSLLYVPILIMTVLSYLPNLSFHFNFFLILLFPLIFLILLCYTGVYYHLWYFPALFFSLKFLNWWKKRWKISSLLVLSFFLLLFGATETYYGVLPTSFQQLLQYYYHIFFTTRNFLFFGLFYVTLGYFIEAKPILYSKYCFEKLILSILCLIFEAIFLHDTNRLNSNILLSCIPLTYYLFLSSFYIFKKSVQKFPFREYSKYYYLLHPALIFFYFLSGIISTDTNSYLQIVLVLVGTHILSFLIITFKKRKNMVQ